LQDENANRECESMLDVRLLDDIVSLNRLTARRSLINYHRSSRLDRC